MLNLDGVLVIVFGAAISATLVAEADLTWIFQ